MKARNGAGDRGINIAAATAAVAARKGLQQLKQSAHGAHSTDATPDLLQRSLAELAATLDVLRVAEESLRVQSEQLAIAQRMAEAERRRYRELFDFAPDGYLVTDTVGIIQEANEAAATLLGVAPRFLLRKPLVAFIRTAQGRAAFRQRLLRPSIAATSASASASAAPPWEVRLNPRRAVPFLASLTMSVIADPQSGTPVALRWLMRDVTEQKAAAEVEEAPRRQASMSR